MARPGVTHKNKVRFVVDRQAERALLEAGGLVGGMDEVGRGSLAGPVTVGLAIVGPDTSDSFPSGLADSKQLSPAKRQALVHPCQEWVMDWAVAHASASEINSLGIVEALRLAGMRALEEVAGRGHRPDALILDGSHNWLRGKKLDLFESLHRPLIEFPRVEVPQTQMMVKADARCAVVAAASILAKVERDTLMSSLQDPGYGWESNKGYSSPTHVAALRELGPSAEHRISWHLPGLDGVSVQS